MPTSPLIMVIDIHRISCRIQFHINQDKSIEHFPKISSTNAKVVRKQFEFAVKHTAFMNKWIVTKISYLITIVDVMCLP